MLWTRHAFGDSAFRAEMAASRRQVLRSGVTWQRPVIDTAQTDLMALLNTNSYQKGGWVLHMLRGLLGDSAFFRGVRTYYARHRHANALTDDLRRALEEASGQSLSWFFDQWLRRPGAPVVTACWRYDRGAKRVLLEVTQGAPPAGGRGGGGGGGDCSEGAICVLCHRLDEERAPLSPRETIGLGP
jgi:aminopeptidase N